ncbi:uncharacterized protein K441DRAFT_639211 [Cenococcum geophilum 1.58]|uniref:uncharacterized protein n=1 Tax=Cenococcum geophilum 1.58 TaxID=794803 RepID=UPI00358EF215|nr:hypothetical protein K441DRAFT_639211 [Cenococcum geophilum 1.58]
MPFIFPGDVKERDNWHSDAPRVAARRAMAKQSSRSSIQSLRRKSWKKPKHGISGRPQIKVDTSFTRHQRNAPRQMLPYKSPSNSTTKRSGNTPKKTGWRLFGKGASKKSLARNEFQFKSKTMRLQETAQGTGLPSTATQKPVVADMNAITPTLADHTGHAGSELTPGPLMPKKYLSIDVSPSDRPITIGISIPSDTLSEHDSYRTTRERSESDTTLVTPSIIITPAMVKSVWSPDSEVNYRPISASSTYSQATIYPAGHSHNQDIPPVPALPSNVLGSNQGGKVSATENRAILEDESAAETTPKPKLTHSRNDTRDSTMTAFEEDEDTKRKDRIMSSSTLFEEDQTPLAPHDKSINTSSGLKIDTTSSPSMSRLSRGWWNVITTPFELSRSNSTWTAVPNLPHRAAFSPESIPTHSNYIRSATEKSPSVNGADSFHSFRTSPFQHSSPTSALFPHRDHNSLLTTISTGDREVPIVLGADPQPSRTIIQSNDFYDHSPSENTESYRQDRRLSGSASISSPSDHDMRSPTSVGTSTPVLGVASIGTILVPREVQERQRPMSDIPEVEDHQMRTSGAHEIDENRRQTADSHETNAIPFTGTSSAPTTNVAEHQPPRQHSPPIPPPAYSRYAPQNKERRTNRLSRKKQQERKRHKRRMCCWGCCCIIILALVALIVALSVTLTRKHKASPIQPSQWLNLTGYPPIPTGISTVAQPEAVVENSGCVSPATIWSCALPKEEQASNAPSKPDQPNMRLEISFVNGSVANSSMTQTAHRRRDLDRVTNPVSAGSFIRSHLLRIRGQLPNPSPAVPSLDDQKFLGNTTDGNSPPFEGEQTPFYISLIDPTKVISARLAKRSTNPFQNITSLIPAPAVNSDGTAAAATLLPLPSSQPLRLYNRGLPTEHYGFYTYFDRSIFLKSIEPTNSSFGGVPADTNGGSSFDSATLRCTWAQTRFLVQIWTNAGKSKPLLQGATPTSSSTPSPTATGNSSANDFIRPGSFPYPVTITLDRHGGSEKDKMIYCYGMDTNGKIIDSNKGFVLEDRSFGGVLVNPTEGPFSNVTVSPADGGPGGIDGGTGGCECQWANWLQS